jgi:hypothetical protein
VVECDPSAIAVPDLKAHPASQGQLDYNRLTGRRCFADVAGGDVSYPRRIVIVKLLLYALATLSVSAIPAISIAQSSQPLTRAQVIAELIELEHAGFHPGSIDYVEYPGNLQAAEARIAAKQAKNTPTPTANGSSQ